MPEVRAAIAGIGASTFSRDSGKTELALAIDAIEDALDDAGIDRSAVDGMVTYTVDETDEIDLGRTMGLGDLTFFSRVPHGGGGSCGTVHQAVLAVAAGAAEVVVCYRSINGRSGKRLGAADRAPRSGSAARSTWYKPFGLGTPAQRVALIAQRYAHEYGATSEDFGRITVLARQHAATNPKAVFHGKPITLAEHQASRWIAEPLRLLDCCLETDAAVAIVVTSVERARAARHGAVLIKAAAQGIAPNQESMASYYRPVISGLPSMGVVGDQLWARSGLRPADIQVANLYDHFTPYVLMQLEELGFCGRGEAAAFVADGHLELTGSLPSNTNGGLLGEAYVHGMNGISEAVRQVRGTAVTQVPGVEHALVTAGTGVPTSGLVLGRDG
jgi:acetyl-CoA acetyltransferase